MAVSGFDHLVVRVNDIEEGIATYRDKLGFELDRTDESEALGIKQAFFNLPDGGLAVADPETNNGLEPTLINCSGALAVCA